MTITMGVDYDKLFKRAKLYGEKMGLGSDAEDFAQECLIKAFEVGNISLEYMYLNYRNFHRTDKRILSGPEGKLSGFRTISLDTPIDSSDSDSATIADFIGMPGDDLESADEARNALELLELIVGLAKTKVARKWALLEYSKILSELV